MKLIKPSIEILKFDGRESLKLIEKAGRTCYKSEDKITDDSASKFVEMLTKRNHMAMTEHSFASVRVICDRGVTHEIVRHRLFSYAQESTRYCNYGKKGQVTFIIPEWVLMEEGEYDKIDFDISYEDNLWALSMLDAEKTYLHLIKEGRTPQQARSVLPNSLKTEIVVSGNFREWLHFFKLRCDKAAHPDMQVVANMIYEVFHKEIPEIFTI